MDILRIHIVILWGSSSSQSLLDLYAYRIFTHSYDYKTYSTQGKFVVSDHRGGHSWSIPLDM